MGKGRLDLGPDADIARVTHKEEGCHLPQHMSHGSQSSLELGSGHVVADMARYAQPVGGGRKRVFVQMDVPPAHVLVCLQLYLLIDSGKVCDLHGTVSSAFGGGC